MDSDDLGDGPFRLAGASPTSTEDAVPATSDVPEVTAEAAMIETQSTDSPAALAGTGHAPANEWPDADRPRSAQGAGGGEHATSRTPTHAAESRVPRRENPLVAGLVKAMREAAVASRDETLSRLHSEAEARVESIRTRATTEAEQLKQRSENDIAEIREWSKAEIARIRQETEQQIEARRTELTDETARHAASVERLVTEVHGVVEAFQADMDRFFERLLAEDDPGQLAALAEQAPDAPDLTGEGPAALDLLADDDDRDTTEPLSATESAAATAEADAGEPDEAEMGESAAALETAMENPAVADAPAMDEPVAEDPGADAAVAEEPQSDAPMAEALEAEAAAAAEIAASEGLDLAGGHDWPAAGLAAAQPDEPAANAQSDSGSTRLHVTGLASVAGISALKGALGQLPGVNAVSVSSGERGVFVFAVKHDPGTDLATGLTGLQGFGARITAATEDGIAVVAHEPAA